MAPPRRGAPRPTPLSYATWEEPDISQQDRHKLESLWTTPGASFAAYGGKHLLREAVKREKEENLPVDSFLQATRAYTRTYPARKKIIQPFYSITQLWSLVEIDLITCIRVSEQNDHVKYILYAIEAGSRKCFVYPLKDKTGASVTKAFKHLLDSEFDRPPLRVRSDYGGEFDCAPFRNLLKQYNIRQLFSSNTSKASLSERGLKTLMGRISRYLLFKNTYRFIDVLQSIVDSINNSPHAALSGLTPNEVTDRNLFHVWSRYYTKHFPASSPSTFKFKLGEPVRVSLVRQNAMEKAYRGTYSEEIFFIQERLFTNPRSYRLHDILGKSITGTFFEQELLKAPDFADTEYKIDKVISSRKNRATGQREVQVNYEGWPAEATYWVPGADVRKT
ncbi:hypothetical protein FOCC_FOCC016803 [Frankliniella occidentalis]|nr:hypothetical protein FOCC_FOCC016803 [Frankliniella occidentalis]